MFVGIHAIVKIEAVEDPESIGRAIRRVRRAQGLTQADVAALADVGVVTVYNVERGKPTVRLDALGRLASVLGLQIALIAPAVEPDGDA